MLLSLNIRNFLLIEQAQISFDQKLSVITGETGAGKSLILDSLLFVLGEKPPKIIRNEQAQTIVTAEFDISKNLIVREKLVELSIEVEDLLIIRRVIEKDGKIKNYLNDVGVSAPFIKDIANYLIEIYSQHQQQSLLSFAYYLDIVDDFAKTKPLRSELNSIYQDYNASSAHLKDIKEQLTTIARERDYLEHVFTELSKLNVYEGEEQELIDKRLILMNKEKLLDVVNDSLSELTKHNAGLAIINAQKTLIRNNNFSHVSFDKAIDYLEKTTIELDEATSELHNILNSINDENEQLDQVEQRLFAIKAAAKKHGINADNFSKYLSEIKNKLSSLDNQDQEISNAEEKVIKLKSDYQQKASQLSKIRADNSILLEQEITHELVQLKMAHIKFKIIIDSDRDSIKLNGFDKISFMISPNPGVPLADLAKIASGGELSRFMLAVCVVLSRLNQATSLLFDEIDTGLSGAVADAVGSRLLLIAQNTQVLTITHQPQIASKGNSHIKVFKSQTSDETNTKVMMLNYEERIREIASMISGEQVTNEAIEAAKKLIS
ncbi:DNA repair protein RecN [Candidatus Arcanobacter lacustris]|jgi:DNA repair protein RecN (Recombination protein N)|uniref:DNA repair protein RecN n=1 Tax=Candidatus Arcanibacter lacustris TaxID=1607817 RepID=A0A0F5MNU6_9RICK|nr:DNA repair protein RecN [Candidatus Arcanobacter lacustris]